MGLFERFRLNKKEIVATPAVPYDNKHESDFIPSSKDKNKPEFKKALKEAEYNYRDLTAKIERSLDIVKNEEAGVRGLLRKISRWIKQEHISKQHLTAIRDQHLPNIKGALEGATSLEQIKQTEKRINDLNKTYENTVASMPVLFEKQPFSKQTPETVVSQEQLPSNVNPERIIGDDEVIDEGIRVADLPDYPEDDEQIFNDDERIFSNELDRATDQAINNVWDDAPTEQTSEITTESSPKPLHSRLVDNNATLKSAPEVIRIGQDAIRHNTPWAEISRQVVLDSITPEKAENEMRTFIGVYMPNILERNINFRSTVRRTLDNQGVVVFEPTNGSVHYISRQQIYDAATQLAEEKHISVLLRPEVFERLPVTRLSAQEAMARSEQTENISYSEAA
ncbi:MAG: hypothetical protein WCW27_06400 [Patescibacteria group bacterium]|jgi:hypothetical protein